MGIFVRLTCGRNTDDGCHILGTTPLVAGSIRRDHYDSIAYITYVKTVFEYLILYIIIESSCRFSSWVWLITFLISCQVAKKNSNGSYIAYLLYYYNSGTVYNTLAHNEFSGGTNESEAPAKRSNDYLTVKSVEKHDFVQVFYFYTRLGY